MTHVFSAEGNSLEEIKRVSGKTLELGGTVVFDSAECEVGIARMKRTTKKTTVDGCTKRYKYLKVVNESMWVNRFWSRR